MQNELVVTDDAMANGLFTMNAPTAMIHAEHRVAGHTARAEHQTAERALRLCDPERDLPGARACPLSLPLPKLYHEPGIAHLRRAEQAFGKPRPDSLARDFTWT
ncbi:hypothetical protein GCM10020220_073440 [Nonomuraea rubra]